MSANSGVPMNSIVAPSTRSPSVAESELLARPSPSHSSPPQRTASMYSVSSDRGKPSGVDYAVMPSLAATLSLDDDSKSTVSSLGAGSAGGGANYGRIGLAASASKPTNDVSSLCKM